MRKQGFHLKHGYVVVAIPDSGLFVKDGLIVSGHSTKMRFDEMILFSREQDAADHAQQQRTQWARADMNGHNWSFPVIPVLVHERL